MSEEHVLVTEGRKKLGIPDSFAFPLFQPAALLVQSDDWRTENYMS